MKFLDRVTPPLKYLYIQSIFVCLFQYLFNVLLCVTRRSNKVTFDIIDIQYEWGNLIKVIDYANLTCLEQAHLLKG